MAKKTRLNTKARTPRGTRVVIRKRLGRKPPPPNETARDRFCRIGERRMSEIIGKITLLGNLSGANYDCTEADLEAMKSSLQSAIDGAFARFRPSAKAKAGAFSFTGDRAQTQH